MGSRARALGYIAGRTAASGTQQRAIGIAGVVHEVGLTYSAVEDAAELSMRAAAAGLRRAHAGGQSSVVASLGDALGKRGMASVARQGNEPYSPAGSTRESAHASERAATTTHPGRSAAGRSSSLVTRGGGGGGVGPGRRPQQAAAAGTPLGPSGVLSYTAFQAQLEQAKAAAMVTQQLGATVDALQLLGRRLEAVAANMAAHRRRSTAKQQQLERLLASPTTPRDPDALLQHIRTALGVRPSGGGGSGGGAGSSAGGGGPNGGFGPSLHPAAAAAADTGGAGAYRYNRDLAGAAHWDARRQPYSRFPPAASIGGGWQQGQQQQQQAPAPLPRGGAPRRWDPPPGTVAASRLRGGGPMDRGGPGARSPRPGQWTSAAPAESRPNAILDQHAAMLQQQQAQRQQRQAAASDGSWQQGSLLARYKAGELRSTQTLGAPPLATETQLAETAKAMAANAAAHAAEQSEARRANRDKGRWETPWLRSPEERRRAFQDGGQGQGQAQQRLAAVQQRQQQEQRPAMLPSQIRKARQHQEELRRRRNAAAAERAKRNREPERVVILHDVTVRQMADLLDVSVEKLEAVLEGLGDAPRSPEERLALDSAELAALEMGRIAAVAPGLRPDDDADAVQRPAIVTVMGHVDHGKTTLLDALRSTAVAAGEAGGITQHIGAFQVSLPGSRESLTFLDTPGHAAFSSMRARGAAVTDLVVLVVAADDGVMPQTREALAHARASGCPIVVAITKCDLATGDASRVRQQLLAESMETEDAGGPIQVVEVAAAKGEGLQELEEALLLQAGEMKLLASPTRTMEAVVVESRMDKGLGPVATVIVKHGTLKPGQSVVVGTEWGKVRSVKVPGGKACKQVLPGQPAEISGLRGMPHAGDDLQMVATEERARRISAARTLKADQYRRGRMAAAVAAQQEALAESAAEKGEDDGRQALSLVIKADVWGSAQAVQEAVQRIANDQISVRPVYIGVGPIGGGDVDLAAATGSVLVGFNVRPQVAAVEAEAKQAGVEVVCHSVIYHLLEDIARLAAGMAPQEQHEVVMGQADVLQIFELRSSGGSSSSAEKDGRRAVAGVRVTEGSMRGPAAGLKLRVLRSGEMVWEGRVESLRRHKNEVDSVGKGTECGLVLEGGYSGFQLGDVLQCIGTESRPADSSAILGDLGAHRGAAGRR